MRRARRRAQRRLRDRVHRGDAPETAGRGSPRELAPRHRHRRRRDVRRLGHSGAPRRDPRDHSCSRTARSRSWPRDGVRSDDLRRRRSAHGHDDHVGRRGGREGRLHRTSCSRRSSSSPSVIRRHAARGTDSTLRGHPDSRARPEGSRPRRAQHACASSRCGTSWHAGLVGKYLRASRSPASRSRSTSPREFRYRRPVLDEPRPDGRRSRSPARPPTLWRRSARRAIRARATVAICNVVG